MTQIKQIKQDLSYILDNQIDLDYFNEKDITAISNICLNTLKSIYVNCQITEEQVIKIIKGVRVEGEEEEIDPKIKEFRKYPHYKQGSRDWLTQRNNYLTASTIAAAIGLKGKAARRELLIGKVSFGKLNTFRGNSATNWGNKHEEVANMIYCYRNNVTVHEFGLIPSEKYPILGVSPDGIVSTGRMLEIKCPYSRIIDGKIKTDYYHQMQEQMTVCEYDECDFLEVTLRDVSDYQFWEDFNYYDPNDNINREKGIVIAYLDMDDLDEQTSEPGLKYMYSPIELGLLEDESKLRQWVDQNIAKITASSGRKIFIKQSYWHLKVYNCQEVKRDPEWIVENWPILQEFWKEVEHYREVGVDKLLEKIEAEKKTKSKKRSTKTYIPQAFQEGNCFL